MRSRVNRVVTCDRALAPSASARERVGHEPAEGACEGGSVARGDQHAGLAVAHRLGDPADARGDDRSPERHRLQDHVREGLRPRRRHEHVGARSTPVVSGTKPRKCTAAATPRSRARASRRSRSTPPPAITSCAPGCASSAAGIASSSVSIPLPGRSSVTVAMTGPRSRRAATSGCTGPSAGASIPL